MDKYKMIVVTLLVLLFFMGSVMAENTNNIDFNQTTDDIPVDLNHDYSNQNLLKSASEDILNDGTGEIMVENWDELQYYSSLNDNNYVLKLKENTNYYPTDVTDESYQILFNNNVTIIGSQGAYFGDSSPNARNITYTAMMVPDNNGVGIILKNITFKWISTQYQPDGVFLQMGGNAINTFQDCYFTNISTNFGHSSILHIKTGGAIVDNCTFINCTTDFGCISVYNPNDDPTGTCTRARMNVTDSYFEGNYARTEPGCINNCGVLVVRNTTFYKNSAFWWAGAIHTHGGANTTIYDSDFLDNLAGWNGGALYTYSYLQIYNSRFIGNNCTTNNGGGAIGACKYLHAPYIYIVDSLFEDNENLCWGLDEQSTSGTGRGGAISLMDEGGLEVYNSTFIKNSASIGTAICAINGGLSYGSPDIKIIGNSFINHTRVGDVLNVRVSAGSNAEIRDNYFENNSIVFSKLKLSADDPDSSGRVNFTIDAELKNPKSYDEDILDKSSYDVYVDRAYATTVNGHTFTLDLGIGNNAYVYVVPSISNSKSNEVFAGKAKEYIYVSQKNGNDNNDGSTRDKAVKTLNRSIELARAVENIIIIDGTFAETNLVIDYNLTIAAESGVAIKVTGNAFSITDGNVKFDNVVFKNSKYGSSTKNRLINQKNAGFLILDGCTFENNEYKTLIEAAGIFEAENLKVTSNKDGSFVRADSISLKNSLFADNVVSYSLYNSLIMYNSQTTKLELENLTFMGNTVHSGCVVVKKGSGTITDCTFIGNGVGAGKGSAIYMDESSSLLVESCKFINNTDTGKYSSVIYLASGTLILSDSILINNHYENTNNLIINGNEASLKKWIGNNNWWGNTPDNLTKPNVKAYSPSSQLPTGWDPVQYWLVLNVTALSNEMELNQEVPVQFMFTQIDNEGNVTGYDGVKLPSFDLALTPVNGTCGDSKITVENGIATTYFTLTQMSTSSLTGTFNGISTTINFQFKKSIPEMTISTNNISVGSTAYIVVNLTSGATGNVVLRVGNISKTERISDSKATFSIPGLPVGNYTIEANYTGNDIFKSTIQTANLTVNKANSTTTLSAGNIELNKDVVFTISISSGATGTVDMYVNGIKETTVDVGQTFTINNIQKGDYVVRAVYSGDSNFLPSEDEYSFDVGKLTPAITVTAPDITYGENTIVNVNLNNDATGNVTVTIDGKTNASQLNKGKASVSISGINAGSNKVIKVGYSGDSNYKNATATKTYNVNKANLNFTIDSNNIKLGQDAIVTIQLPPRSGGTLSITGIKSEIKNIPLTGLVTLTYSDLTVGTYTVLAEYNGDNYQTASKSTTFDVSDWDVPKWPNEGYDVKNTEKSPYSSEANGNVLWVKDIDGAIIGNMAIDSNGNVYITTANGIYSINPDDGSTNWIFNSQDAGDNFSGIAISRDTVLAPKSGDKLYFINQMTGEQYRNNIYQGSSVFAPIVDDNANIYITGEYQLDSSSYNLVIIPYKLWSTSTKPTGINLGNGEPLTAPVIVDGDVAVVGTKKGLIFVNLSSQSMYANYPIVSDVRPVVGFGNILYTIADNSKVMAFSVNGEKLYDVKITGTAGNYLSVGKNYEIYSINREGKLFEYSSGDETLIYDFKEPISSGILVGNDEKLYVGSESGMFYAIDAEGNLLWEVNLNQSVSGLPVMDSNGVIYVISGNRIVALDNVQLKDSKLAADIKNVTFGEDVIVDVGLDKEASGKVSIKIGDSYVDESVVADGKVTFIVSNLQSGTYSAKISYSGDGRFKSKDVIVKFNVDKKNVSFDVGLSQIQAGETLQINVTNLPDDSRGTISVTVGGKSNSTKVLGSDAKLYINGLTKGEYDAVVTYSGDANYNGNSVTKHVSVGYILISFKAVSNNVSVGQDVVIAVTDLPGDADGIAYVIYDKVRYSGKVNKGGAKITIPGLGNGTYAFDVEYANDTKYTANSQRVSVVVSKIPTDLTVSVNDIYVGDDLIVDVGLDKESTGNVSIKIGDSYVNESVVADGKVSFIVSNLQSGAYSAKISYSGDGRFKSKEVIVKFNVDKRNASFDVGLSQIQVGETLQINVTNLPDDAGGTVSVTVGGKSNSTNVFGSDARLYINGLTKGEYDATVTYSGDTKYNGNSVTKHVSVGYILISFKAVSNNVSVGQDVVIAVTDLPGDADGIAYVIYDKVRYSGKVNKGGAKITIPGLGNGTYAFDVEYANDTKYTANSQRVSVVVSKIPTDLTVSVKDIYVGDDLIVDVSGLPIDATGSITVGIGKLSKIGTVVNGSSRITIQQNLANGSYQVDVTYSGDKKYSSSGAGKKINVSKKDTPIIILADDIKYGENLVVSVNLNKDATGNVTISIGDMSQSKKLVGGSATTTISSLTSGDKVINVEYSGDGKYNSASSSKNITVSNSSLIAVPIDVEIVDNSRADITIANVTGNISVIVDGDEIKVPLDKNGKTSIDLSKFSGGNHSLVVVYDGNDVYAPSYAVSSFNIAKGRTSQIATDFRDITVNDDMTVSFVLRDANDKVIANAQVTCNLNGAVSTKFTDSEGSFAISIKNGDVVYVSYAGNDTFKGSDLKFTFNGPNVPVVLNIASRFNIPGGVITINGYAVDSKAGEEGIYYSTELLDENGKPIKGAFIQFAVNNKIYNRTTDDKGSFDPYKLNMIRAGRYTMAFYFSGDESHTSTFAAVCVDLDKKPITIKASAKSFKASASKKYTVTLSTIVGSSHDGKVYLSPKEVKLTVNGKTYTGMTNSNGKVTFNLKITKKGKYTAKIGFEGDSTYESATKSVKLTVK